VLHKASAGESRGAVKVMIAQAKIEARIGGIEYVRELLTAARESSFSTKELDDVVDAEWAKLK
jgi:hypothetical protein